MNHIFKFKKALSSALILSLLFSSCGGGAQKTSSDPNALQGTISISGAFALYPITVKWAEEFKKIHPGVKFNISAGGAGKGIADALGGLVDIGLASRDIHPEEVAKGAYTVFVAKDAVLPTFNPANPNAAALLKRGITREELNDIFVTEKIKQWEQLSGLSSPAALHVYVRSDAAGAGETWANYFDKSQEDLKGIGIFGDPGLAQAVMKDPISIGFNNISYLYNLQTRKQIDKVQAIPIDVNGNGKVDPEEDFYGNVDDLTKAISNGQYPTPPARNLGFLFKGKPEKKEIVEFVKYALSDGQKFLDENGYIHLSDADITQELEKIK
jgi:phosphate transport system substrate-binding protein